MGWVIPPGQDAEFATHMEQVLDVYKRPYDEEFLGSLIKLMNQLLAKFTYFFR